MDGLAILDPFELPDEEQPTPAPATAKKRRYATASRPRTTIFSMRVFPSERIAIRAAARRARRAEASAWAREVLLAAAAEEEIPALDEAAVDELLKLRRDLNSGVGANLNQALRIANEWAKVGKSPDEDALVRAVEGAQLALDALRADLARLTSPRGRR